MRPWIRDRAFCCLAACHCFLKTTYFCSCYCRPYRSSSRIRVCRNYGWHNLFVKETCEAKTSGVQAFPRWCLFLVATACRVEECVSGDPTTCSYWASSTSLQPPLLMMRCKVISSAEKYRSQINNGIKLRKDTDYVYIFILQQGKMCVTGREAPDIQRQDAIFHSIEVKYSHFVCLLKSCSSIRSWAPFDHELCSIEALNSCAYSLEFVVLHITHRTIG